MQPFPVWEKELYMKKTTKHEETFRTDLIHYSNDLLAWRDVDELLTSNKASFEYVVKIIHQLVDNLKNLFALADRLQSMRSRKMQKAGAYSYIVNAEIKPIVTADVTSWKDDSNYIAEFCSYRAQNLTVILKYDGKLYTIDTVVNGDDVDFPSINYINAFTGDPSWPVSTNIRKKKVYLIPGVVLLRYITIFTQWYTKERFMIDDPESRIDDPLAKFVQVADVPYLYGGGGMLDCGSSEWFYEIFEVKRSVNGYGWDEDDGCIDFPATNDSRYYDGKTTKPVFKFDCFRIDEMPCYYDEKSHKRLYNFMSSIGYSQMLDVFEDEPDPTDPDTWVED